MATLGVVGEGPEVNMSRKEAAKPILWPALPPGVLGASAGSCLALWPELARCISAALAWALLAILPTQRQRCLRAVSGVVLLGWDPARSRWVSIALGLNGDPNAHGAQRLPKRPSAVETRCPNGPNARELNAHLLGPVGVCCAHLSRTPCVVVCRSLCARATAPRWPVRPCSS